MAQTITKVFSVDEDGDEAKTHLQQLSTSLSRRKKEIFPKLSASTIRKRPITATSICERRNKSQKTSDGFANFHASDCS